MVHMKSVLVTIVSAKTILHRATAGLCELSHRSETSVTGHSLNVINSTVTFIVLIVVLIKISIRIRPNTN